MSHKITNNYQTMASNIRTFVIWIFANLKICKLMINHLHFFLAKKSQNMF
jgi:hypothetical protein